MFNFIRDMPDKYVMGYYCNTYVPNWYPLDRTCMDILKLTKDRDYADNNVKKTYTNENLTVSFLIPGLDKTEISITWNQDDDLIVKGENKRFNYGYCTFIDRTSFSKPEEKAKLHNGILSIVFPRCEITDKNDNIDIQ